MRCIFTGLVRHVFCLTLWVIFLLSVCNAATSVYVVGSIPSQEVHQGSTLQFQIQSPKPGAATFSYILDPASPVPQGILNLDQVSGVFTYKPTDSDKFEFRLNFISLVAGASPDSQLVSITPVNNLPPETDVLSSSHPLPDPASTDYLLVTQAQNSTQEMFNTILRTTWNIDISGKTVIFDSSTLDHGGLFTRFNGRPDIKNFSIYAETVIIRSPLKLPGTNVVVYARHLRFEDTAGQASVDTTPIGYSARPNQGQNGAFGQNAGNITLHVLDFFSQTGPIVRFIANGGTGQDAGEGRAGNPKPDLVASPPNAGNWGAGPWNMRWGAGVGRVVLDWPFFQQQWGWVLDQNGQPLPQNPTPYPSVVYVRCDPCGQYVGGQPVWPADGEDAVSPGTPGTGGPGGVISSTVQTISTFTDFAGGLSGTAGSAQPGGPAQNPTFSAWLQTIDGTRCNDDFFNFQIIAIHRSIAGKDAPSIPSAQPQGVTGSFSLLPDPSSLSWLHPFALRQAIAYAKDVYRSGNLSDAQKILQDYSDLLSQFSTFPPDFSLDFEQTQNEITELLHRLASNLDYFGHTAGWVPLLSLQATMTAFSNEVDASVPILFLSQWLQAVANKNAADITALQDTMNQLANEANAAVSNVNAAQQNIPSLQNQAGQINAGLQNIEAALQQRETELLQKAEHDVEEQREVPGWKKALRLIGTVAETVPAFQPALGTIGAGLNFVTNFDISQPLQSLQNAPDLTTLFKGGTWSQSETDFNTFLKSVDFRSFSNAKGFAKELDDAYKAHQQLIAQTIQQFQTTQISDTDVKKEFAQLKAQDSRFNDLVQQVADLQTRKQMFAQSIANTLQEIAKNQATINKDLLSVASMFQNLNTAVTQFDHGMMGYVQDMDRRARERLLQYQYYMAKAYEYYMLQPYPGDLNIQSLVDEILHVMSTDGYSGLTSEADLTAIKAVYLDSVRTIISTALTQLQTQPPERSLPFFFNLTQDQLNQLNGTGQLDLDLTPLIQGLPNEDDRHLADLTVTSMTVQTNGQTGPAARVRLIINHRGDSTETLAGHAYKFHFGNGPNDQPFTWGASFNLPNGPLSQESLSVSGLSLLQSFLNISGPTDPRLTPLMLFARPGADAVVTLVLAKDPADLNATITDLQISATIDFFRTTSSQAKLFVKTASEILPYIKVDHSDVTGRRDGLGAFIRTYSLGDSVTLQAEPNYGPLQFMKWVDDSGKLLGVTPTLSVTLASATSVIPIYALSISGHIQDGNSNGVPNIVIGLSGTQSGRVLTDANGDYQFDKLLPGSYILTPSDTKFTFTPATVNLLDVNTNQTVDFQAQPVICSFSINPNNQSFYAAGGDGSVVVTTQPGCDWNASSADPAVVITSGNSGSGSGTVNYSVEANTASSPRAVILTIAGQKFTVNQSAMNSPVVTLSTSNLNFQGQLVGSQSSTQSIGLKNTGNAILNVISISLTGDGSGDFAIADMAQCEPTIDPGASCAISVAFTPHQLGKRTAAVQLNDDAAGSPQTVTLAGVGAGFSISAPSSISVTAGQSGIIPFTVPPTGGYTNQVSFTCTGAPAGASCAVSPDHLLLDGNNPGSATATVTTTGGSSSGSFAPRWTQPLLPGLPILLILTAFLFKALRREKTRVLAAVPISIFAVLLLVLSGCGGKGGPQTQPGATPATPRGTYDLIITGTSSDFATKTIVKLTVN